MSLAGQGSMRTRAARATPEVRGRGSLDRCLTARLRDPHCLTAHVPAAARAKAEIETQRQKARDQRGLQQGPPQGKTSPFRISRPGGGHIGEGLGRVWGGAPLQMGVESLAVGRGTRELLPLPLLPFERCWRKCLSRGCRQRMGRRRAGVLKTNEVVNVLIRLYGQPHTTEAAASGAGERPCPNSDAVELTGFRPVPPRPHEAASTLLRSHAGRADLEDCSVVSRQGQGVAPGGIRVLRGGRRVVAAGGLHVLQDLETGTLRGDEAVFCVGEGAGGCAPRVTWTRCSRATATSAGNVWRSSLAVGWFYGVGSRLSAKKGGR